MYVLKWIIKQSYDILHEMTYRKFGTTGTSCMRKFSKVSRSLSLSLSKVKIQKQEFSLRFLGANFCFNPPPLFASHNTGGILKYDFFFGIFPKYNV
jgi:hypothetical protein